MSEEIRVEKGQRFAPRPPLREFYNKYTVNHEGEHLRYWVGPKEDCAELDHSEWAEELMRKIDDLSAYLGATPQMNYVNSFGLILSEDSAEPFVGAHGMWETVRDYVPQSQVEGLMKNEYVPFAICDEKIFDYFEWTFSYIDYEALLDPEDVTTTTVTLLFILFGIRTVINEERGVAVLFAHK